MRIILLWCLLSLPVLALAQPACLHFDEGWVRLPPTAQMPMAAGYGILHNACTHPLTLRSASSPLFEDVSLHRTVTENGISRMDALDKLEIAAGESARFAPGGLHLMLMHPRAPLSLSQRVPVTLVLEDGSQLDVELDVRRSAP